MVGPKPDGGRRRLKKRSDAQAQTIGERFAGNCAGLRHKGEVSRVAHTNCFHGFLNNLL